jgi:hypothetical protein
MRADADAQGIGVPEHLAHELAVDDRHRRAVGGVLRPEVAAAQQRHSLQRGARELGKNAFAA